MCNNLFIFGVHSWETYVQDKLFNALERFGSSAKANLFPPNLFKAYFFYERKP